MCMLESSVSSAGRVIIVMTTSFATSFARNLIGTTLILEVDQTRTWRSEALRSWERFSST